MRAVSYSMILCIAVFSLLSACIKEADKYVSTFKCPEARLQSIKDLIQACHLKGSSTEYCRKQAQELFCEKTFVKNPNYTQKNKD